MLPVGIQGGARAGDNRPHLPTTSPHGWSTAKVGAKTSWTATLDLIMEMEMETIQTTQYITIRVKPTFAFSP